MEYLVLFGLVLFFLFFVAYFFANSQGDFRYFQANSMVTGLAHTADKLNTLGPQNKEKVYLDIPSGITGAVVKGKVISIEIAGKKEPQEIRVETTPHLIGGFSVLEGNYHVSVKALNETLVRIGQGLILFSVTPTCSTINQFPFNITFFGDEFTKDSKVLLDNAAYPEEEVMVVDATKIVFSALPGLLQPHPQGEPYLFSVQVGTLVSNTLPFHVYPASNFCGTKNPLLFASKNKTIARTPPCR